MVYSLNINKPKIEIDNVEVTQDLIIVHCTFNFDTGYSTGYHKSYPRTTFSGATAVAEAKAAWTDMNDQVHFEKDYRPTRQVIDWT